MKLTAEQHLKDHWFTTKEGKFDKKDYAQSLDDPCEINMSLDAIAIFAESYYQKKLEELLLARL